MQSKILLKWPLFLVSIAGLAVFFVISFLPVHSPAPPSVVAGASIESAVNEPVSSEFSVRLKAPSISLDAAVEPVGLTADGAMDVPKDKANAGWYSLGPRPGQVGSAVIDGHSGWYSGVPMIFNNLSKLRPGDKLYVEDNSGTIITFIVRELRTYDPAADASDVFGSSDSQAHLNLITCEGTWNEKTQDYSRRLVVFTDQEIK